MPAEADAADVNEARTAGPAPVGAGTGGRNGVARLSEARDPDDALMARIAAGERRAFDALVHRHLDRVHALAARVVGRGADAEEVAQEVFLRVWRSAGRWQPGRARFTTWLYRVTFNQAVNHRRRVMRTHADLAEVAEPADPGPPPDARLAADADRARLTEAVAALPENQRLAVTLTYTAGLSNAEGATAMRLSVKAYEALLVRARRSLRARLARPDEDQS